MLVKPQAIKLETKYLHIPTGLSVAWSKALDASLVGRLLEVCDDMDLAKEAGANILIPVS
jgi:hypothetical protein